MKRKREIKLSKKMTLIESFTVYQIKHYELDDEKIIKDFGSIEEFEQYEDQTEYLINDCDEIDYQTVDGEPSSFEYFNGHIMVNSKGRTFEKEN